MNRKVYALRSIQVKSCRLSRPDGSLVFLNPCMTYILKARPNGASVEAYDGKVLSVVAQRYVLHAALCGLVVGACERGRMSWAFIKSPY